VKNKKTFLMVLGFAVVLAAANACFGPSSKPDRTAPANGPTNATPGAATSR
jgi:hypothetical protein